MMIISFAWTTEALISGRKTVTRRYWSRRYAQRFHAGDLTQAYDRSPRYRGQQVAIIRLTRDPYTQSLDDLTDEDERKEGGLWGSAQAFREVMWGANLREDTEPDPFVLEFELVAVSLEAAERYGLREPPLFSAREGKHGKA